MRETRTSPDPHRRWACSRIVRGRLRVDAPQLVGALALEEGQRHAARTPRVSGPKGAGIWTGSVPRGDCNPYSFARIS